MTEAQELSLRARRKKGEGEGEGEKSMKGKRDLLSPILPRLFFFPSSQSPTPLRTPAVQTTRVYNLIYGRPGIVFPPIRL